MASLPHRLRGIALALVAVLALVFAFAPPSIVELLRGIANWWSLALILGSAGTLVWFVYWVYLRRWLRVRRIANIRLRRMLGEREDESG
jgi:hypothetical protein